MEMIMTTYIMGGVPSLPKAPKYRSDKASAAYDKLRAAAARVDRFKTANALYDIHVALDELTDAGGSKTRMAVDEARDVATRLFRGTSDKTPDELARMVADEIDRYDAPEWRA